MWCCKYIPSLMEAIKDVKVNYILVKLVGLIGYISLNMYYLMHLFAHNQYYFPFHFSIYFSKSQVLSILFSISLIDIERGLITFSSWKKIISRFNQI